MHVADRIRGGRLQDHKHHVLFEAELGRIDLDLDPVGAVRQGLALAQLDARRGELRVTERIRLDDMLRSIRSQPLTPGQLDAVRSWLDRIG